MKRMLCFRIINRLGIRDKLEIRNGFAIVNVLFFYTYATYRWTVIIHNHIDI